MDVESKRRLVARMLGVGVERVKIDPEGLEEVRDAITRRSLRALIERGIITIERKRGQSRGRARERRGKRRGPGSRKGSRGAREDTARLRVLKVRALRRELKRARERGLISKKQYWELYYQVKGGQVRTVRHLRELIAKLRGEIR